jgi:hypothetical protein
VSTAAPSSTPTATAGAGATGSNTGSSGGVAGVTAGKASGGGVLGALAHTATKQTLPFTGLPLWIAALVGAGLVAFGLSMRRHASVLG